MSTFIIDFYAYVCYSGFKLDKYKKQAKQKQKRSLRKMT